MKGFFKVQLRPPLDAGEKQDFLPQRDSYMKRNNSPRGMCLKIFFLYLIYSFLPRLYLFISFGVLLDSIAIWLEYGGGNGDEREAEAEPRLSDAADER